MYLKNYCNGINPIPERSQTRMRSFFNFHKNCFMDEPSGQPSRQPSGEPSPSTNPSGPGLDSARQILEALGEMETDGTGIDVNSGHPSGNEEQQWMRPAIDAITRSVANGERGYCLFCFTFQVVYFSFIGRWRWWRHGSNRTRSLPRRSFGGPSFHCYCC